MSRLAPMLATGGLLLALGAATAVAAVSGEFLVVQNAVAGRGGIWGVDATGANPFAITPPSGFGANTSGPPPDPDIWEFGQARNNGRIAFSSTRVAGDSRRIYLMNGDNSGVTQVTFHNPAAPNNQDHFRPSISADGSKIAYLNSETIAPAGSFSSNENCTGSETTGLWVVNADGSNPHVVRQENWAYTSYCNAGFVADAVISPDGTKIVVKDTFGNPSTNCGIELVAINIDGTNPVVITCFNGNSGWGDPSVGLDWSPDGSKIVATVPCGGSCTQWVVYNTSTWQAISAIPVPGGFQYMTRFSPDSSLLGYFNNNDPNGGKIHIMDLSGNEISSFNLPGFNVSYGGSGSLWWGSSTPGTLQSMTLGVSSVYVNACPTYMVQLKPSTFNSTGALVTHGYTSANVNTNYGGDGDSWHVDGFGNAFFNPTRGSVSGTLQLFNFGVSSDTIPLTADSACNCEAAQPGLTVTRGPQRLVNSAQQQFLQTITVTNTGSSAVAAPINVVIQSLPTTAAVTNSNGATGCTSPGSPFMTVLENGSLPAGASVSVQLQSRDSQKSPLTYTTAVVAGAGAP